MKNFATKSIFQIFTFLLVSASVAAFAQQTSTMTGAENSQTATPTNVVKICLALPKVQLADDGNSQETAVQLRGIVAQRLKSKMMEPVEMQSGLSPGAPTEVKEKGCQFVLQTALTQKKGSGFGNILGSLATKLGTAALGAGKSGGTDVADQIASTAIQTAANLFSKVKSKEQITIEYSLALANNQAQIAGQTLTAKVKSESDDVISPMIEKMVEAVRQVVAK